MLLFDDINLEHRSELYGALSLWLMVFHLNMFFNPLFGSVYLGRFASLGDCCVDVFLFISGYCIFYSWTKEPVFRKFIKKRILRIVPTYLIIAIPFFLWQDHLSWRFLYDLSGASFIIAGRLEAWFPIAILFFYLISPWLIRMLSGKKGSWIFFILIILIAILINHIPYFAKTGIMWSRLPAYTAGVYCAQRMYYSDMYLNASKGERHTNPIKLLLFGTLMIVVTFGPGVEFLKSSIGIDSTRLVFLLFVIPIIFLFNYLYSFTPSFLRLFLRFCGNLSLEIYLIHLFLLYVISHYGLNVYLYPIALLVSIPLAYIVSLLVKNAPRKVAFNNM